MPTHAFKCFTHDLRPPVQGGDPVWSGSLPYYLPHVAVDAGDGHCAAGWNACETAEDALRIGGFWPNGRPSRIFAVETIEEVVARGDKLRAATWTVTREVDEDTIGHLVETLSRRWFGDHANEMAIEQLAWRHALARPERAPDLVEQHLALALDVRGLPWRLRKFDDARAAWAARAAGAAWDAWAARDARDAWDAWDAWDARDARDARAARAAWAAGAAWAALAALAARDALIHHFAVAQGWIKGAPEKYTVGIRDAYACGLAIALPTGPNELGWATE